MERRIYMAVLLDDNRRIEKINGIIYNMSPSGSFSHCQINGNIHHAIRSQLKDSLCAVSMENFDLHLAEDEYVSPDIMIMCDRKKAKGSKYYGVPRFVVETLSPSTALKDKTVKKDKYASLGIDEYWIVSPKERSIEIYYLENQQYQLVACHILEEDETEEDYNSLLPITLKALPTITILLKDVFENIE